jgi:MSHA biogenesis protein MshI
LVIGIATHRVATGGRLIGRWKKQSNSGWRAALVPAAQETGLAFVQQRKGERPLLQHCGVYPTIEIKAEHVLTAMISGRQLARAPVSGVISPDDYQLMQVEAPQVAPAEMRAAIRWKLRDLISFPLDEAVIDTFDLPEPARKTQARMVFALAARSAAVQRLAGLIAPRARGFDIIDIPELCLRNLSALLPQDEAGVAFLVFGQDFAHLLITCRGVLHLTRRIDLSRAVTSSDMLELDALPKLDVGPLALELQRSLDYYENVYDRSPISELVLAPADDRVRALASALALETSVKITLFEPERLFQIADGVEVDARWNALIALGAALRAEQTDA